MTTASASARRDKSPAPSMDDILAQIRRTLSGATEPAVTTAAPAPLPGSTPPAVAVATVASDVPPAVATVPAAADDLSDLIESDPPAEPQTAEPAPVAALIAVHDEASPQHQATAPSSQPPPLPLPSMAPAPSTSPVIDDTSASPPTTPAPVAPALRIDAQPVEPAPTAPTLSPPTIVQPESAAEPPLLVVPPPARGLLSIRELGVNRIDASGAAARPQGLTVPSHIGARPPEAATPTHAPPLAPPMAAPGVAAAAAAPVSALGAAFGALGALEASLAAGGLVTTAPPAAAPPPPEPPLPIELTATEPTAIAPTGAPTPALGSTEPVAAARFVVPAGLEDGIVEALRPALRAWLDETVPRLAEEAARAAAIRHSD